ncbi:MAG: hypothetical protein HY270_09500 [Deltaproteobacteria bacterium]|nr:hypothetical protein [Deltaproteobacteria bacterium]
MNHFGPHTKLRTMVVLGALTYAAAALAVNLDSDGDVRLGVRTYVNARVGTQATRDGVPMHGAQGRVVEGFSATFPPSAAGHLRQNRIFLESELNLKLDRLLKQGVGPFNLVNDLPFRVRDLGFNFTLRAEGDGLYNWGPREYSTAEEFKKLLYLRLPAANQTAPDVAAIRQTLRSRAVHRERLFLGYVEANLGNVYFRLGRQVLSWGEDDAFQLLDHINPLDASFGGFLIPLDERRVPLDMLRVTYGIGTLGPVDEAFLEGFVADDNRVGFSPAIPPGSPWTLPSFGSGTTTTHTYFDTPSRTAKEMRGGARFQFNWQDATFSLAYLSTYFDTPAGELFTRAAIPQTSFDDSLPCPSTTLPPYLSNDPTRHNCGSPVHVFLSAPRTQVFGTTSSFAVPALYSVIRSELAYFKDEAAYSQEQFDPFLFGARGKTGTFPGGSGLTGGRRLRDSINLVLGADSNVWIRFLNPNQTFFITTQFFYKHIKNAAGNKVDNPNGTISTLNGDREVLPVVETLRPLPGLLSQLGPVEPVFARQPRDSFLQTLVIATSYYSSKVNPVMTFFYDWGGAFLYQPSVTLVSDPFRFSVSYSIIDAHMLKGSSGVSLLKDRDNIEFRLDYVI